MRNFEIWASDYISPSFKNFIFVTDGPCDIRDFVRNQYLASCLPLPSYFDSWIDIKRVYKKQLFGIAKKIGKVDINGMLEGLGMVFEGRLHSGLHDTSNFTLFVNII